MGNACTGKAGIVCQSSTRKPKQGVRKSFCGAKYALAPYLGNN